MSSSEPSQPIRSIQDFLECHLSDKRVHPKSLVSTFFGDMVVTHDNFAWVETVFAALELLGGNDRLVRTTLFRLREEGWFKATRSGRKSYYQLTEFGDTETRQAETRIYYPSIPDWDGSWTLVFLVIRPTDLELLRELEQELGWIGFGCVTRRIWAYPGNNIELVSKQIHRLGLKGKVIAMRCENIHDVDLGMSIDDRELAALCIPISEVEELYRQFIQDFSVLLDEYGVLSMQGSNAEMLSLRLLMMDEYRRITLRDPHLPTELLSENWTGQEAFLLCGKIYKQICKAADAHYLHLQENAGSVSAIKSSDSAAKIPSYEARFRPQS